jgi:hypothetical protein
MPSAGDRPTYGCGSVYLENKEYARSPGCIRIEAMGHVVRAAEQWCAAGARQNTPISKALREYNNVLEREWD